MGNYKFKLSNMMPNAWFYKLKDMSRVGNSSKKQYSISSSTHSSQNSKKPHIYHSRKSYYLTRELTNTPNDKFYNSPSKDPPRKSLQNRARRKKTTAMISSYPSPKLVSSTVSSGCSCRTKFNHTCSSFHNNSSPEPELLLHEHEEELPSPETTEFRCDNVLPTESSFDEMVSLSSSSDKDIIINVDTNSLSRKVGTKVDSLSRRQLPPIITQPDKFNEYVKDVKKKQNEKDAKRGSIVNQNKNIPMRRRISVSSGSPRVRVRISSPKIRSTKLHGHSRKSLSDSFAVVKASHNPQRDFKESMMEMIVENNIRASKDLEDLLACYLSLNSDEYHQLIIKVFKEIWFDIIETRIK